MAIPSATAVQEDVFVETPVYELPEPGMHEATITKVENLGEVKHDKWGVQKRVKIYIRIDDEKSTKGETMFVFINASLSTGGKSRLGTFLRQVGVSIPPQGERLNLAELVNMKINVNVIHAQVGEKTFANVESAARMRRSSTPSATLNTPAVTTI